MGSLAFLLRTIVFPSHSKRFHSEYLLAEVQRNIVRAFSSLFMYVCACPKYLACIAGFVERMGRVSQIMIQIPGVCVPLQFA